MGAVSGLSHARIELLVGFEKVITREAVAVLTPARSATSLRVAVPNRSDDICTRMKHAYHMFRKP